MKYVLSAKILTRAIYVLSITLISSAYAEEKLDEVVVTANKRVENINDITTSITSLDKTYIKDMGVNKIEDLVGLTNNLHFTESGLSTQVRIRGIGSGNSQGFEQSVAQYVDGVYYGRAQLFRTPIYDVSNIEILRGSQNALFGKDSIAGTIAINTAEATSDSYGNIGISYSPELNRETADLAINGALTDTINGRLSVHGLQDDGYLENTTKGVSDPSRKEKSVRVKLNWQPTDSFTLNTKIESSSFNVEGRPYEITFDKASPLTLDLIARQPGNATLKAIPSTYNNILTVLLKQPSFDTKADWQRQTNAPEISNNHVNNFTLDGVYDFGDIEWHNKLAQVNYGYNELVDADYTPANIFVLGVNEHYQQNSFDSFVKNSDESTNQWLVGAYAQQSKLDYRDRFFVPADSVLKALGNPLPGTGAKRLFNQEESSLALYGEYTFKLLQSTDLIINGRYTLDKKDASRSLNIINAKDETVTNPAIACAYLYGLKADTVQSKGLPNDCGAATPNLTKGYSLGHDLDANRNEGSFSPSATLNHKINQYNSVYVSVKSGHKSGGFDPRSNSVTSFEFNEESALTYEFGLRTQSPNGRFENGITVFDTSYKNLQVSQFDGGLGFNVGNAKKTESKGFEFDGRVLANDNLLLTYSAGYVDIKYKDFKNGNCYQGQSPNGVDSNGDGLPDLCNYSGSRPAFAPAETFNLGAQYNHSLFNGEIKYAFNLEHVSKHNVHENLNPNGYQDAYYMLNANIVYTITNLEFRLTGNNLTNEYVKTYQANAPLSGSQFKTDTFYTFAKSPKSITVGAEYNF